MATDRTAPEAATAANPPQTADDFPVSFYVFVLARTYRAAAAAMLTDIGLDPGQEILLMHLDTNQGQSQKSLRDSLRADHSTVAKSVARLQKAGLVTKTKAEYDDRFSLVALTPKGARIREKALAVWTKLEDITVARLTEPEQRQLTTLVAKLAATVDPQTRRPQTW